MRMLMLIVDDEKKETLEAFLSRAGVTGFTEIPQTVGTGTTGPRLGSSAFPRTSAIIFTILENSRLEQLTRDLKSYCAECGERLKMFGWDVEEVL